MSSFELIDAVAGYKGTDVLRGISLSVRPGDIIGILGPNGAGKSTLLRVLSGQLKLRGGSRVIDGVETAGWPSYRIARSGVRWTGDPRPIYRELTVLENLEIAATKLKGSFRARLETVHELLPVLAEKQSVRAASLSGGQQQMLAIGQALMSDPKFLLLDEPSLGLAVSVVNSLATVIKDLAASGVGIVWAEQFPEIALQTSTEVAVISAGRIVLQADPAAITRDELDKSYLGSHGDR